MNLNLIRLAIDRAKELGQEAYTVHQELEKWRELVLTAHERIVVGLKLQRAVEEQRKWLNAVSEEMEEDEE